MFNEFFKSKKNIVMVSVLAVLLIALVVCSAVVKADEGNCPDCSGIGLLCDTCGGDGTMDSRYFGTFMSLAAPIIAIALALITKEVYSSLFIGIVIGGLLNANYKLSATIDAVTSDGLISAVSGTAGIFIFLVILGAMVILINRAGGSKAFGKWAQNNIKTKVGATIATFVLGVLIFIDDYFNCLTVGSVMRPVTDSHKISRGKLAFIIDATAAPICMIAPISSWAAAVSAYAPEGTSGLKMFVTAIPFNFYSILTLIFVVMLAIMGFDYGKMSGVEFKAQNGDLGAIEADKEEDNSSENGRVIDLILPIVVLIIACVIALIYNGGFFDNGGEYYLDFIGAFGNTDATVGLPWGSLVALIFTIVYLMCRKAITFKESMRSIPNGFIAMVPAILILSLATALKNMTSLLGSDIFVDNLLSGAENLTIFLPAIIFLLLLVLSHSLPVHHGAPSVSLFLLYLRYSLQAQFSVPSVCPPVLQVQYAATTAHLSPIPQLWHPQARSATMLSMFRHSSPMLLP